MTETKRRIRALKKQLPAVKGKVAAMAVSLLLAVTMLTSVSFAWFTMSRAPEVSSIQTRVSANGNLEVALAGRYDANGNLLEPASSAVGDSAAAQGQVASNLTWGNLINLSGNYGIENLILRPAVLSDGSGALLNSIYYGPDGRYEAENVDFAYTYWLDTSNGKAFTVNNKPLFGVRAISTVTYPDGKGVVQERLDEALGIFNSVRTRYAWIVRASTNTDENKYISAIQELIGVYATAELNNSDAECNAYIEDLCEMMQDLHENVIAKYGEALVVLANAQQGVRSNNYTPYTLESLIAANSSRPPMLIEGVTATINLGGSYDVFRNMYVATKADLAELQRLRDNKLAEPVMWSKLEAIVDRLIEISNNDPQSVLLNGQTVVQLKQRMNNILANISLSTLGEISALLGEFKDADATIRAGFLWDIEYLTKQHMNAPIETSVSVIVERLGMTIPADVKATVHTDLRGTNYTKLYDLDVNNTKAVAEDGSLGPTTGTMIAGDTYGMVIDFWVRTNASGSMLTLDGMLKTEIVDSLRTKIMSGETKQIFTYTYYIEGNSSPQYKYLYQYPLDLNGNGEIEKLEDAYKVMVNGVETSITLYEGHFYDVSDQQAVKVLTNGEAAEDAPYLTYEYVGEGKPIQATVDKKEIVVGYEGSNRVDFETLNPNTTLLSATQGSGSCYIFYADSPEELKNAKELLNHLKVAFVDRSGKTILAQARLDVGNMQEDNGKYVVPLVLEDENSCENANGDKGIVMLNQNEATFISAVVYLDGMELENKMVLDKGSIKGSLNIQFATDQELKANDDEDVNSKTIQLSASISENSFEYKGMPNEATLTATVVGVTPETVQAAFVRMFNSTQGAQMEYVNLEFTEGRGWIGTPTFTLPGTYILSTLWVDGVEYALPDKITVEVSGLGIGQISFCTAEPKRELTTDSFTSRSISIKINAGEAQQPERVYAMFETEAEKEQDKRYVTSELSYDSVSDEWSGMVRFTQSGDYRLTYIQMSMTVDGKTVTSYTDVSERGHAFTAKLNLRAVVNIAPLLEDDTLPLEYEFKGARKFRVVVEVVADDNKPLVNESGVKIKYKKQGESYLEKGLNEAMIWNGTCYECIFDVKNPGTYSFAELEVGGDNVLRSAQIAPAINAYVKQLPVFVDSYLTKGATDVGESTNILLMTNADGTVKYVVNLKSAASINLTAVFKSSNSTEPILVSHNVDDYVANDAESIYTYTFNVPKTDGSSNGEWVLQEIRATQLYALDGTHYDDPESNFYTIPLAASALKDFAIVDNLKVTVDSEVTLGSATKSEAFMTEQKVGMIPVRILTGASVEQQVNLSEYGMYIKSATITFTHAGSSDIYGGYTFASGNAYAVRTFALEYNEANKQWYLPADRASVYLAGEYKYHVNVVIDVIDDPESGGVFADVTYANRTDGKTILKVYSTKPTVKITDITMDGDGYYAIDVNTSGSAADTFTTETINSGCLPDYKHTCYLSEDHRSEAFAEENGMLSRIENDNRTAWLYFRCYHHGYTQYDGGTNNGSPGTPNFRGHTYSYDNGNGVPAVTLQMTGIGHASSAYLQFQKTGGGDVIMITEYTADRSGGTYWGDYNSYGTDKFEWTNGGADTCKRFIGVMDNGAGDSKSDTKTVAGTITAKVLVMVYEGVEYSFAVPAITINNPY